MVPHRRTIWEWSRKPHPSTCHCRICHFQRIIKHQVTVWNKQRCQGLDAKLASRPNFWRPSPSRCQGFCLITGTLIFIANLLLSWQCWSSPWWKYFANRSTLGEVTGNEIKMSHAPRCAAALSYTTSDKKSRDLFIIADFQNSFTDVMSKNIGCTRLQKFSPHLKCVTIHYVVKFDYSKLPQNTCTDNSVKR